MLGPVSFDVRTDKRQTRRKRAHNRYSSSTKETSRLLREAADVAHEIKHTDAAQLVHSDSDDGHCPTTASPPCEGHDDGQEEFQLLRIRPTQWVRNSLFDIGYMEYVLSIAHGGSVDNFTCRYTTLAELCDLLCRCDSCRLAQKSTGPSGDVATPRRHAVPLFGKVFQTHDECEQRARDFTAMLGHLFDAPHNCFAQMAIAHVYEKFPLTSTCTIGYC